MLVSKHIAMLTLMMYICGLHMLNLLLKGVQPRNITTCLYVVSKWQTALVAYKAFWKWFFDIHMEYSAHLQKGPYRDVVEKKNCIVINLRLTSGGKFDNGESLMMVHRQNMFLITIVCFRWLLWGFVAKGGGGRKSKTPCKLIYSGVQSIQKYKCMCFSILSAQCPGAPFAVEELHLE